MKRDRYSAQRKSLAKARQVLAEKGEAEQAQEAPKDFLKAARRLAELYRERDLVDEKITALEATFMAPRRRLKRAPRGLQQPTLHILALVPEKKSISRQEAIQKSQEQYGDRYSPNAVRSSLYRLVQAGILVRDGDYYARVEKK